MFIAPMLLQRTEQPRPDANLLNELKLDGIRLLYSNMDITKLYTRHNNDVTTRFPEITDQPIPPGTVLDGELILTDENGHPDFEALMSRFMIKDLHKIKRMVSSKPVTYCVFDILYYRGKNVCSLPLIKRKDILAGALPKDTPRICRVQYFEGQGIPLFNNVAQLGLEGIVQKDPNSTYQTGHRSPSWNKVINYSYTEVWIKGYRKSEFGWLLAFEDGRQAGIMELGVPIEAKKAIYLLGNELKTGEKGDFVYFKEGLKCQVKYRCLTKAGLLRLPSFVRFVA